MKSKTILGLTILAVVFWLFQGAITQARDPSMAQITFYVH